MRWLFVILIGAFTVSDVFGWDLSLGPGLSVKNAVLYLILFTLMFRAALHGVPRMRMPGIHIAFFVLVGYATVSWIVAAKVVHYTGYDTVDGLITLKSRIIDPALMLLAVFYAIGNVKDALFLLKCLLGAIVFANLATVADLAGFVKIGMEVGETGEEEGRVFGAFGHANETGALIVCMLPAMVAFAFTQRGIWRWFWGVGSLVSLMVLLMTVSRGAFVGLAFGSIIAAFICRKYVPLSRFAALGVLAALMSVVAVAVASLVDPRVGATITRRLLGQSKSVDVGEVSSGRTAIWTEAFRTMFEQPITLLTGYGWDVYAVMPFRYATHNYYLGVWFDLGIVCLALIVFILARSVINAFHAVPAANREMGTQLLAFVFGILGVAVAIFFVDMWRPWAYIWLYVGAILRLSLFVLEPAPPVQERTQPAAPLIGAPLPAFHRIATTTRR